MSNLNFSILPIYLITQKTNKRVPTVRQISFGALAPQNMCYKQCAHLLIFPNKQINANLIYMVYSMAGYRIS
jgi:hypothetical protein